MTPIPCLNPSLPCPLRGDQLRVVRATAHRLVGRVPAEAALDHTLDSGSLILFVLIGACWLLVLWLQIRACRLAQQAHQNHQSLPQAYLRVMRWWFWLGWPAFLSVIGTFWLMISKPA